MFESAPNGYFLNDLIVFHGLGKGCHVSKGFLIEPPELSTAAPEHLNAFQDQIALVLALSSREAPAASAVVLRLRLSRGVAALPRADGDARRTSGRAARATSASPATGRRCRSAAFAGSGSSSTSRGRSTSPRPPVRPAERTCANITKSCSSNSAPSLRSSTRCSGKSSTARASSRWATRTTTATPSRFLNPSLAERFDFDPLETYVPGTFHPGELLAQRSQRACRKDQASGWTATIIPSSSCIAGRR